MPGCVSEIVLSKLHNRGEYMQNRLLLLLAFLLLTVTTLQAQIPIMNLKRPADQPISLASLDARVRIFGHLAETTMTMRFFNPNSRVLEGELEFPLPEGAVVSGYALDIDGELVEGVAIEKQKAREVLETEIRRGVDPGIVEKVKGNNFKTRVYPLNPNSSRTVQVVYITELAVNDGEALYRVPLRLSEKTENFNLRVEVLSADQKPKIEITGRETAGFSQMKSGWFTEVAMQRQKIDSEVRVTIPVPEPGAVFVEEASDGNFYFSVQGLAADPEKNRPFKPAEKIVVLYDASGSGAKRDLALEKKFIEALFASERVAAEVRVEFVEFRNRPGSSRSWQVKRGDAGALIKHIEEVKFDGGTNFTGIGKELGKPDCYLLITDGLTTFGKSEVPDFAAPVYAITSADGADYSFLQHICRRSGGSLLNLKALDLDRAVKMVGADFFGIIGLVNGKGIEEVFPTGRVAVNPRYMLAGLLSGDEAKITLSFGTSAQGLFERSYDVSRSKAVKGDFLRKFWAGRKVDELLAEKEKNRLDIVTLSKKHGVVNEFTSMIVLERIDQYIEHKIVPPASKPAWREQYFAAVEKAEAEVAQTREQKLNSIIPEWEERLRWWETDFSKAQIPSGKDKKSEGGSWYGGLFGSADRERSAPSEVSGAAMDSDDAMPQSAPEAMRDEMSVSTEENKSVDGSIARTVTRPSAPAPARSASAKEEATAPTGSRPVNPGVAIKAWQPDARYAKAIKEALDPYTEYLKQKAEYGNAPSYFLDCADVFIALDKKDLALQVLSNIAELELENPALMRILAHRLAQLEELAISAMIFEEVLEMRGEEPQSYRDLALVLGRLGKYQRAVELLYDVVLKKWDGRFPGIEVIALEELNNLVVKAKKAGIDDFKVDSRLLKPIDVDLRIVMTWDADATDMDLWVVEPSGEKAYYGYPHTAIGGLVSRDLTRGYGPEEYMLRKARTGMYEIQTNFYGSSSQRVAGAVTLQIDIFTNYGRDDEKRRSVTLRLTDRKETFKVADIEF